MGAREILGGVAAFLLVLAVLALVLGQLLGQPVLFGFVTSGSMAPTLDQGDGFIAVPTTIAGEPEVGDVVVFEAETIQGGGLTTHRIVGETEQGFVTAGDANPFTDQDAGEPYVQRRDIEAHVLQVNGEVVAIPHLGTAVLTMRSVVTAPFGFLGEERAGMVLVFVGMALFVLAGLSGGATRRRTKRSRNRENVVAIWSVVFFAAAVLVVGATAAMVVPAGHVQIEMIATEDPPGDDPQVVEPGGVARANYSIHNSGVIPTLVVTDPEDEGVRVDPAQTTLGFRDSQQMTVYMDAPETPGEYTRGVQESRYLVLLPVSVLLFLHAIHPLLALLAVDVVVALFVVTVAVGIFGTHDLRLRPGADVPLRIRIERRLRRYWR